MISTNEQPGSFRLVLCCDDDATLLQEWQRRAPACFSLELFSSSTPTDQIQASLSDGSAPFALVGMGDGCTALVQSLSVLLHASCTPAHIVLIHPATDFEMDSTSSAIPLDIISDDKMTLKGLSSPVTLVPTTDMWSEMVLEQLCRIIATQHLYRCYHENVLAQAIRTPNLPALICGDTVLSYQQLCARAWSLYCRLRPLVSPGTHIALSFPLGIELVVSYMAASMLQCPFTEMAMGQAIEITESQLQEWQPELMLHATEYPPQPRLVVACASTTTVVAYDDSLQEDASLLHMWGTTQGADVGSPAFIAWTSGSTGRSKGACATHKNLANMAFWRWWEFPPTKEDRNVSAQNLFFVWYWFIPLYHGGTTVIIPQTTLLDPPTLVQYFEQHQVTRWDCASPTLLRTILQMSEPQLLQRLASRLTTMHSGGELLEVDTCRLFHQWLPGVVLINGFATTETVCDISYCNMTPQLTKDLLEIGTFAAPMRHGSLSSTAGMAWNSSFSLIDLAAEITGQFSAATGQLVASGVQTAKEYYKRPEISDCFGTHDSGVDYVRLNDVAEELQLDDGGTYLVVRGRIDSVVKVMLPPIHIRVSRCTLQCDLLTALS